jgi:hypothetical protein
MEVERAMMVAMLLAALIGCSPAAPKVEAPTTVDAQPDQVAFYERPQTLAAARRSDLPAPLVVSLVKDPWTAVIGSDSPSFALYEDGTVIQRNETGFSTTQLSEAEREQLLERLDLQALAKSYGHFEANDSTDQPNEVLLVYQEQKPVFISVYGSLRNDAVRARVPEAVVSAHDVLSAFRHPQSRSWLPQDIEVMIWPYEYAPAPSIKWPKAWPDLSDAKTIQRREGAFSIFMPSAKLEALRAFLRQRREKGAVEIGGRKWSVSIRFPFPHEKLWMPPNPEAKAQP